MTHRTSIVAITGDNVTIEVEIIRAVPPVSTVYWNFTSGIVNGSYFNSSNMIVPHMCVYDGCSLSSTRYYSSLMCFNDIFMSGCIFNSIIVSIADILIDDEGQYTISAENEVGEVYTSVLINVEGTLF